MEKERLLEFGKSIYSPEGLEFAAALYDETAALRLDEDSLALAFLATADVSDKKVRDAVLNQFGAKAVEQIELFARIGRVAFPDSEKYVANLRKLFVQLTNDLNLIFIKLSERLVAMKFAEKKNSPGLERLAWECLYLYSPIAHRLGVSRIYKAMEDISFKHLYPEEFNKLNRAVERRRPYLESKLKEMRGDLEKLLRQYNIKAQLQSRVKRLYSIYRKIRNQGVTVEQIYDLLALRVITDSVESCYLALGAAHMSWIPIESRFRDWIAFPKPNGYRSIQTTVSTRKGDKFEIQIRTEQMHQEAEYGSAAHWAYKEGLKTADSWIARLKEFLENDEYFENPLAFHELLKTEMRSDYVHVLTPKGEIKTLPEGSTPVDFAFSIHTNVGYAVTGARVNGKFAKLNTVLHSGDVVEVITLKNAKPSRDWLGFVKTSRARAKIRDWFQRNERAQIINEGRKVWEKLLKQYRKRLEGASENEQVFKTNMAKTGYKTYDDFFFALGGKSLKATLSLLKKLYPEAFRKEAEKKKAEKAPSRKIHNIPNVLVEGIPNIETKLAQCCHPIRGEEIVAYVTRGGGIKVHSRSCKYINSDIFNQANFKRAEWLTGGDSLQTAYLEAYGYEAQKMLISAVEVASDESVAIVSTNIRRINDNLERLTLEVRVKDVEQLRLFGRRLKSAKDIDSVTIL